MDVKFRNIGDCLSVKDKGANNPSRFIAPYLFDDVQYWGLFSLTKSTLVFTRDFDELMEVIGDGVTVEVQQLCHCKGVFYGSQFIGIVVKHTIDYYEFLRIFDHKVVYIISATSFRELAKSISNSTGF